MREEDLFNQISYVAAQSFQSSTHVSSGGSSPLMYDS